MFKKHAPLLFFILSLISIKLSSENFENVNAKEPKVFELSGLKILTSKREVASESIAEKTVEPVPAPQPIAKASCTPIQDINFYKDQFIQKNKSALKTILGPWYLEKPKDFKFEYSFYENMSSTAVYSSGLHAAKRTLSSSPEKELNRYTPTNIFYKLYYKDRTNSDTMFYIYGFYRDMKVDASTFKYLKTYLKESSKHETLSLKTNKEILKLSTDPESLMGAFAVIKDFPGLSTGAYRVILKELDSDTQTALAKEMIKTGSDKSNVNAQVDWSPNVYQAAFKTLEENDLSRPYLSLSELKDVKADSSDAFMDKLGTVKTNCDLEDAWSVASSIVREL